MTFPYFPNVELTHDKINLYNIMVNRKQIDHHLQQMASINANIGIDSTDQQREDAKKEINNHLAEIYKLDENFFNNIKSDEIK